MKMCPKFNQCWWECELPLWKSVWGFFTTLESLQLQNFWEYSLKDSTSTMPHVQAIVTLFVTTKNWNQLCPLIDEWRKKNVVHAYNYF